ncbi:hypothetical protein FQZ97_908800 [compost metagenome]
MVEDEQKWPTTPTALSWSTRRLATDTACFGSQASSALTRRIFSPLTPPAALMSSAAWVAPRQYCSPKVALPPVCGPATPITTSAWTREEAPNAAVTASARKPFLKIFCDMEVVLLRVGVCCNSLFRRLDSARDVPWDGLREIAGNRCLLVPAYCCCNGRRSLTGRTGDAVAAGIGPHDY